jgi:hypothetical protein
MLPDYLTFDIETRALDEAQILADAEPFDAESVKIGGYTDESKIVAKIEKARADYERKLIDRAALSATTGAVLAIGTYHLRTNHYQIIEDKPEEDLLLDFWTHLYTQNENCSACFVGFNILAFDLPFLLRRSWFHKIPVQPWIFDGRYFHHRFRDVLSYWRAGNRLEVISLDKLARFFSLGGKSFSGKDFAKLYANNKAEAITYLKHDLKLTSDIALRIGI